MPTPLLSPISFLPSLETGNVLIPRYHRRRGGAVRRWDNVRAADNPEGGQTSQYNGVYRDLSCLLVFVGECLE
jgi:hypothetical protein